MKKTKVIVIGTGMIAKEHLRCLNKLPGVEIAGVCDISPAKAEATAERFHIPNWDVNYMSLIEKVKPDMAHITTSANSHYAIAEKILHSGVSAFVEKPITPTYAEFQTLKALAAKNNLILLENHNYQFNWPIQETLRLIHKGVFGTVNHLEVNLCLNIGKGKFNPHALHPTSKMPGGIISEFLTHMANLTYIFIGPHTEIYTSWKKISDQHPFPFDEFRAMVETNTGSASISFSANSQPEGFWVCVHGSKMRAWINLFEDRLYIDRMRNIARPLMYLVNGISESGSIFSASIRSLWNKLKGNPGGYSGLQTLIKSTYKSINEKKPLPITMEQIDEVNRLVSDMTKKITDKRDAP